MKNIICCLTMALCLLSTGITNAQTTAALLSGNGKVLIATTRAVPPVNIIESNDLADIKEVIILDEKTMQPESGQVINSFTMTIITPGGNVNMEAKNNTLTEAMKMQLQQLKSGDKVYFEYIKGKNTDGTERSLSAMAFEIK